MQPQRTPPPPRRHEFGVGLWVHYIAGGPGHATLRLGEIREAVERLPGVTSVHAHPPALVGEHRPHEENR